MAATVVTGSASGLGAALARRLREEGRQVIGLDRHDADVVADLGSPEGRREALAGVLDGCGGTLDGVVSCAGLGPYEAPGPVTSVNFFGAVAVLDGLLEALARGREPAAVAICSVGGAFDDPLVPNYLAACHEGDEKRALEEIASSDGITAYVNTKRALAQAVKRRAPEWGRRGVRINAVAPGWMATPMLDRLIEDATFEPMVRSLAVPLGRQATAEEVAGAVHFLLGPDARYVHGHVLFADGGAHALLDAERM